jgi:hypothetical protein
MALTQNEKDQITRYKIQIEGYRKELDNLKKVKKQKSEYWSALVAKTKDANSKRSYRQSKLSWMNSMNKSIDSKKQQIDRIKDYIANIKK